MMPKSLKKLCKYSIWKNNQKNTLQPGIIPASLQGYLRKPDLIDQLLLTKPGRKIWYMLQILKLDNIPDGHSHFMKHIQKSYRNAICWQVVKQKTNATTWNDNLSPLKYKPWVDLYNQHKKVRDGHYTYQDCLNRIIKDEEEIGDRFWQTNRKSIDWLAMKTDLQKKHFQIPAALNYLTHITNQINYPLNVTWDVTIVTKLSENSDGQGSFVESLIY